MAKKSHPVIFTFYANYLQGRTVRVSFHEMLRFHKVKFTLEGRKTGEDTKPDDGQRETRERWENNNQRTGGEVAV